MTDSRRLDNYPGPKSVKGYGEDFPDLGIADLARIQSLVMEAHLPAIILGREVDVDVNDTLLIQSAGRNNG